MTLLVDAGEDPGLVYEDQPSLVFSFKRTREKIFAKDMTVSKLSELMGGKKRERNVNWKYVARTGGINILPNLTPPVFQTPPPFPLGLQAVLV